MRRHNQLYRIVVVGRRRIRKRGRRPVEMPNWRVYQFIARFVNVRTGVPVGPFAIHALLSSSHAVPAISRWTQGRSLLNSLRNHAAVIDPPARPPIFARSANGVLSCSLYSSSMGMAHIFSPSDLADERTFSRNASLLLNAPMFTVPSATTTAPVSVAASTKCVQPSRAA